MSTPSKNLINHCHQCGESYYFNQDFVDKDMFCAFCNSQVVPSNEGITYQDLLDSPTVNCDSCNKEFKCTSLLEGKKITCSNCHTLFKITIASRFSKRQESEKKERIYSKQLKKDPLALCRMAPKMNDPFVYQEDVKLVALKAGQKTAFICGSILLLASLLLMLFSNLVYIEALYSIKSLTLSLSILGLVTTYFSCFLKFKRVCLLLLALGVFTLTLYHLRVESILDLRESNPPTQDSSP